MLSALEKKHIRTLNLILVILLGVSLGYLFSSAAGFYLNRKVVPTEAPSGRKSTHIRQPTLQTYQPILAYNLFDPVGRNKPGLGVSKEGSQKRQETTTQRADMILLGTVISSNRPFAVILLKGQEQIFRLDEEIPGAGKLEEIEREEVRVRDQDGTLFTLTLPKGVAPDSGRRRSTSAPSSAGIKEVGENRWVISSQEASKARENMSEIFKQARLEARKVNGQVEGFTVKMIRPRTLLWKLGLKRGDLIKEINGVQLDSDEKVLEIYQQLKEARNISIGLQRRGKNLTFAYEVE
jgi:general secretion pathway protein C